MSFFFLGFFFLSGYSSGWHIPSEILSGIFQGNYEFNGTVILHEEPILSSHAATKAYVDASGGGSCDIIKKIIFVTSSTHRGNLGGLDGADTICQNLAITAGLNGTFQAILSNSTVDAIDRLNLTYEPNVYYYNMNGQFVKKAIELWSPISLHYTGSEVDYLMIYNNVNYNENGNVVSGGVITSTAKNGIKQTTSTTLTCLDWTTSSSSYKAGFRIGTLSTTGNWLQHSSVQETCLEYNRLYCIEN